MFRSLLGIPGPFFFLTSYLISSRVPLQKSLGVSFLCSQNVFSSILPGEAAVIGGTLKLIASRIRTWVPTLNMFRSPSGIPGPFFFLTSYLISSRVPLQKSLEPWHKLFMLSKCVLFNPPRGGCCH